MKALSVFIVFTFLVVLGGCESPFSTPDLNEVGQVVSSGLDYAGTQVKDFAQNNEYAQQAQQATTQVYDQLKQQATQVTEQAKSEINQQYQHLKEEAKSDLKEKINQKVDQTFDQF